MLLQFSVENYKSFKNKTVLSLEASCDTEHINNLAAVGNSKVLKVAAIFGANATGKSNLFSALTSALLLLRLSNTRQMNEPLSLIEPYRFSSESASKPTIFEFVFMAESIKYVYGFSATRERIMTEYLYKYSTSKPTTIFERDISSQPEYKFTVRSVKSELNPIVARNTANKLFLATATTWNCEETKVPLLWLMEGIEVYSTNYDDLIPLSGPMYENDADQTLRTFTNQILHEADINIDDYEFRSKEITSDQFVLQFPPEVRGMLPVNPTMKHKQYEINTLHHVSNDSTESKTYKLNINEESRGTRSLFMLSPLLNKAFETGMTLCFDEFDTSLHPMLVHYLVSLFNNPETNKANAQLIISTHTMDLLSLKYLRRDQIYFVQKDRDTAVSELYALDEFSPRMKEDIRKAYLMGRYGSVPNICAGDTLCL